MLNFIISIIGIILTIFIIVGFHEFGHFIVARMVGIKVLRFSIGFGKTLFRFFDKRGTEYTIAAIPLGGYVKMLDSTEENVPEDQLPFAYNYQPIYKKVLVILAGPLFNFLLALFIYWLIFMIGFSSIVPIVGKVQPNSIAAKANLKSNDEIINLNGKTTLSWTSVMMGLLMYIGDDAHIQLETKQPNTSITQKHTLDLTHWYLDPLKPDPLTSLGIIPYQPTVLPIISELQPDSPATLAKLAVGDKIIAIHDQSVSSWEAILKIIEKNPNKTFNFTLIRQGKTLNVPVTIGTNHSLFSGTSGFLGISPTIIWPKSFIRYNQYGPLQSIPHAFENTINYIELNFLLLGKMISGKISLKSIGGPITIFQSAGTALNIGVIPFMSFLAFLSIAIGTINIVPIPGLDGGHLLFNFIEWITQKPLSLKLQFLLYRIGFILLLLLITQALINDFMRL